jgi:hypothetical protein
MTDPKAAKRYAAEACRRRPFGIGRLIGIASTG